MTDADGGVPQYIDLPGDRIPEGNLTEWGWQRFNWIEHRAGKQENEIEHRGDGVECVVSADQQREHGIEEEPAGRSEQNSRRQDWQAIPVDRNMQKGVRE